MKTLLTLMLFATIIATTASASAGSPAPKNPGLGPDDNGPLKVAEEIQKLRIVEQVKPIYPELAKISRTEGSVTLQLTINREGGVSKVEIVNGPALLTRAAQDAAKGWKYKPTIVNGQAMEVITQVHISFTMK
jgi:protein TonB